MAKIQTSAKMATRSDFEAQEYEELRLAEEAGLKAAQDCDRELDMVWLM